MKITAITSKNNPLLKRVRALFSRKGRLKGGEFLLEGEKLVGEALAAAIELKSVLVSSAYLKRSPEVLQEPSVGQVMVVADSLFSQIAPSKNPAGILAIASLPETCQDAIFRKRPELVVIADAIQDPGNLGTIMRTAQAADAGGIILTHGAVDAFNPKAVRAAAGAVLTLPVYHAGSLACAVQLVKNHNLTVYLCDPQARASIWETDLTGPAAFIFGNEGQGLDSQAYLLADCAICVPMRAGAESLNVAAAAAVVLYEAYRQRARRI